MNTRSFRSLPLQWALTLLLVTLVTVGISAHEGPVHKEIAERAISSSIGFSEFAAAAKINLDASLTLHPPDAAESGGTPQDWLKLGAVNEDAWWFWADHFYTVNPTRTPGQAPGLSDWLETVVLPAHMVNSFIWATIPDVPSPSIPELLLFSPTPINEETWSLARSYELDAPRRPFAIHHHGA